MNLSLQKISLTFVAGCLGGLVNALVVWAGGALGLTMALGVQLAPAFTTPWLYQRLVWGGHLGLAVSPAAGVVLSAAGPPLEPGAFRCDPVRGVALPGPEGSSGLAVGLPHPGFGPLLQWSLGGRRRLVAGTDPERLARAQGHRWPTNFLPSTLCH